MQWYLRVLLLSAVFYSETVESIDVINILIHPTISEEPVTTSITLTCAAYYLNDESFGQDAHILWYFVQESQQNDSTADPLLITANTRLYTGRLMFEIPEESKNTTLHFIDASSEYNGQYYCVAVKGDLRAQSKSTLYSYGGNNSNIFVVEPKFEDSNQSSKQSLTCQTDSLLAEPPDIQWYYNPDNKTKYNIGNNEYAPYNLNFYNIHSELHKSVLELVYASSEYNGEYYCIAKFGENKQSSSKSAIYRYSEKNSSRLRPTAGQDSSFYPFSVAIGVNVGGSIQYAPTNSDPGARNSFQDDGLNGNPISFVCQTSTFSSIEMIETNYEWIYDRSFSGGDTSKTVESNDRYNIIEADDYSELQLRYSSPEYVGSYQCVVYGTLEDGQDTYSVSDKYSYLYNGVYKNPGFIQEPQFDVDDVTKLVTKSDISLTCTVTQPSFYPPVVITWYRGSTNDKNARIVVPPTDDKFKSMYSLSDDETVLTFLTYSSYNNGTYHCEVENSVGKVTSRDALYQYGDYIRITQQQSSNSLVCNYSNANTAADTSHVMWYFESAPGHFLPVNENTTSVLNDNNTSISSLLFHNLSIADAGRYKCLFVKQSGEGKDKWAYGFYQLSMCSMSSSVALVRSGDPIQLSCSCVVPLSEGTRFLFYKDRISEIDKDIFEKYQDSEDRYRLNFQANESGATLTIPYAREIDEGYYECGYQLADEEQRRFIEGGANVTFQGSNITRASSPFGFGMYNITLGLWQDIKVDVNNNGFLVDIEQDEDIPSAIFISSPTFPRFIDTSIQEYFFNFSTTSITPFLNSFTLLSPTVNFQSDSDEQALPILGRSMGDMSTTASTPEILPPRLDVPYTVEYTTANDSAQVPAYYPREMAILLLFPDYNERVVAPLAQYTVLSVGFNDYESTYAEFDLGCVHCTTKDSQFKTRCPYGGTAEWSFQNDENFLNDTDTFEEINYTNKLLIKRVSRKMGGQYDCSFSYSDKFSGKPVTRTASQDIIVEGAEPLKLDHGIELPIRNVTGEPMDVVVYADIWMRQALYSELVVVRWGVVLEQGQVEWLPQDSRQLNDWQSKRLKYRIDNLNDTTYICNVTYLDRTMSIEIPVVNIEKPPAVNEIGSTYKFHPYSNITFYWAAADNDNNNYFRGYEVSLFRHSRDVYSTEPAVQLALPNRQFSKTILVVDAQDIIPYCNYTLRVVSEYEIGRSVEMLSVVSTKEDVPDPPSDVTVVVDSQEISEDGYKFIFQLKIDVPLVSKGEILGYKIQLFSNTSMMEEEVANVTKGRRRREAGLARKKSAVWMLELKKNDDFTAEGGYNGKVKFNITEGFSNVNMIGVSALTSAGYGEPYQTKFVLFRTQFGKDSSNAWVYVVVVLVILFVICLAIAIFCYMKRHQQVKKIIKTQYNPLYPLMRSVVPDQWEINPADLKVSTALGEGAFGRVMKGVLMRDGKANLVAVKMLKEESYSEQEAEALWKEIALMKKVGSHPYIVNIIGCVTVKPPICLLVEYVTNGDLQSYLRSLRSKFEKEHTRNIRTISSNISKTTRKSKQNGNTSEKESDPLLNANNSPAPSSPPPNTPPSDYINIKSPDAAYINLQGIDTEEKAEILTSNHMLNMMYQIACGMQYLSYKNIIHRDLAARNILVGEDMTVKVSDFGLARDMYLEGQYMMNPRGRVPFKWMSPEALFDLKFTSKSDVWSYGVLLWEIVTLGGSPYPGIEPAKLYKLLKKGYRMARPDGCSLEIYDIMSDCWQEDPDLRPPFDDLSQTIQKLMNLDTEDYLTVGQGIASIEQSDDENAVEILNEEVEMQAAEQYSSVTSPPPHTTTESSSSENENPTSPLLSNNRASPDDVLGPIPRTDTLNFPTTTTLLSDARGRSTTGESNYSNYSESCL